MKADRPLTDPLLRSLAQWQYFMMDFCYFVNWACMLSTFFPGVLNGKLLLICFVAGNGVRVCECCCKMSLGFTSAALLQPLAGAIVAWRNSLVFHSLDKVTSVYIHILPALLTYVWRWMPENKEILRAACGGDLEACSLSTKDWLLYPLLFYTVWQIIYLWLTGEEK